jgi:uncharacterized protein YdeI (YjbR/CyaY-like superfamily)
MKYVSFSWPPLEALKKQFWNWINENKEDCHQCWNISFQKMPILKSSVP